MSGFIKMSINLQGFIFFVVKNIITTLINKKKKEKENA